MPVHFACASIDVAICLRPDSKTVVHAFVYHLTRGLRLPLPSHPTGGWFPPIWRHCACLSDRRQPRPKYQPVTGDCYCVCVPGLGIACEPPFAALPMGDFRRILAEDYPVEAFLANFLSVV